MVASLRAEVLVSALLDPTPRERLAIALEHMEAAARDPGEHGRIGLAYVEVRKALDELGPDALELAHASDAEREEMARAIAHTVQRLRLVGASP